MIEFFQRKAVSKVTIWIFSTKRLINKTLFFISKKPATSNHVIFSVRPFTEHQTFLPSTRHFHQTPDIFTKHQIFLPNIRHFYQTPDIFIKHQTFLPNTRYFHQTQDILHITQKLFAQLRTKYDFFKNSFSPLTLKEWKNPEPEIKKSIF